GRADRSGDRPAPSEFGGGAARGHRPALPAAGGRLRARAAAARRGGRGADGAIDGPRRRYAAPVSSAETGDRGRRARWGSYRGLAERLRARIASGDLAPGAVLPSEAALGAEAGVARSTVRRALAVLEADGLVAAVPGRGRVVRRQAGAAASGAPAARRIARGLAGRV